MRRRKTTAYVLLALLTAGAIGVGNLINISFAAGGVLMAIVAITVLLISQRSNVEHPATAAPPGTDGIVIITIMAVFVGVSVVSILLTGALRILEGAALMGTSWVVLGCLLAVVGTKFLCDHWPR